VKKTELQRWNKCRLAETEEGKVARRGIVTARASLNSVQKAKREKWNTFLQNAKGDEVLKVLRSSMSRALGEITSAVEIRNIISVIYIMARE
jgi:hypothetical protein